MVFLTGCHGAAPCAWAPTGSSAGAEALAGARAAPAVEGRYGGVVQDAEAEQRMQHIGLRLTRRTSKIQGDYQYRLLDTARVNAVSLPGGRIYLTRGLYDRLESDAQVAAVLAHEMAHLRSKDHFKPRCSCAVQVIEREKSADACGAEYLQSAGIDCRAMIEVLRLIADVQPKGWSDSRIRSLLCKTAWTDVSNIRARQ